jgi:hypothetical protein
MLATNRERVEAVYGQRPHYIASTRLLVEVDFFQTNLIALLSMFDRRRSYGLKKL